jgi:acetyl-CoA synthetase
MTGANDTAAVASASGRGNWKKTARGFAWDIPARLNIAHLCCDSWAAADPERVAVIHLGWTGASVWTYGDL